MRCYSVSVVPIRKEGSEALYLLLRRRGGALDGSWCLISGCIELGETAWRAAVRELKEETGLNPIELYSADTCDQFYDFGKEIVSIIPAFVALLDPSKEVVVDEEHSDHRWCTLQEAQDLVAFGGQRNLIKFVQQEFVDRQPLKTLRIPVVIPEDEPPPFSR
ncbi:NUDIX domain-containing protein [bacterium]|nr:NUDIX domain-containing protein [bacterium]